MDNFRALPKLNEKLEEVVSSGEARIAKVVGVHGNEVDVELTGGAVARYPTAEMSVNTGQVGIVIKALGGSRVFFPIHRSTAIGAYHYDKGGGTQVGSTFESNIGPDATGFVAIGTGAKVSGPNHIAIGRSAETPTGSNSIAIGYGSSAGHAAVTVGVQATSGSVSTAMGYWSHADGANSVAIGRDTDASASNTVAVGGYATASGTSSAAFGRSATATGEYGLAIGHAASSTGTVSIAIGRVATAVARSVSLGWNATASAEYGVAVGYGADAGYGDTSYGEVAIGKNAKAKTARSIAIGFEATTQYHYEAKIKARGLIIESSQDNLQTTKLGLHSPDGTRYYVYVTNAGVLTTTTTW